MIGFFADSTNSNFSGKLRARRGKNIFLKTERSKAWNFFSWSALCSSPVSAMQCKLLLANYILSLSPLISKSTQLSMLNCQKHFVDIAVGRASPFQLLNITFHKNWSQQWTAHFNELLISLLIRLDMIPVWEEQKHHLWFVTAKRLYQGKTVHLKN